MSDFGEFERQVRFARLSPDHLLSKAVFAAKHAHDAKVRNLLQTIAGQCAASYGDEAFTNADMFFSETEMHVNMTWPPTLDSVTTNAITFDIADELFRMSGFSMAEVRFAVQQALMRKGFEPLPHEE